MSQDHDVLSTEICNFISSNIDSIATLEILFFFLKRRDREWSIEQASFELRSNSAAIQNRVEQLALKSILIKGSSENSYQYQPNSEDLNRLIEKLSQLYPKYPLRVIDQIYSPQIKAIKEFADAFKFKNEDNNG